MTDLPLLITGPVRSGKTTALIAAIKQWIEEPSPQPSGSQASIHQTSIQRPISPTLLVFATNADNRAQLLNPLAQVGSGEISIHTTTPLAFFEDEVILFWPLLLEKLQLQAHFPLRLRPETEQRLAMQFITPEQLESLNQIERHPPDRWVRNALDALQLAAFSGLPLEDLGDRWAAGFSSQQVEKSHWQTLNQLLLHWRDWCLARGLLTYGLLSELYWRHLLPHPIYRQQLTKRFHGIFADDIDNYQAITRDLFEVLLDSDMTGAFTYNPEGAVRWGLGADPTYWETFSDRCQVQTLRSLPQITLRQTIHLDIEEMITPIEPELPETMHTLSTISRAQLLRKTAEAIAEALESGTVQPQDIAVIGPGLDTLARYSISEILNHRGIAVESLKDQRPLISTAIVRALLTLLALIYPGLGELVDTEQVAEMLVLLTIQRGRETDPSRKVGPIDPVRAGLLADYCFKPDRDHPELLPTEVFVRWDRLGHEATVAYEQLRGWVAEQRGPFQTTAKPQPYLTLSPVFVLDRAIQHFCTPSKLSFDQLAALRELIETAQHFWEVETRLQQTSTEGTAVSESVGQFIQLLRQGTFTANPFPVNAGGQAQNSVTLATAFQYRMARQSHRWHFWLDAGSTLWQGGWTELWGAPLFFKTWNGEPLTIEDRLNYDRDNLRRQTLDLLSRVTEHLYLCHSELSVSGQEQLGPMLPLVEAALPTDPSPDPIL